MKISGQEMKVTLPVHGRQRTFSEQQLIAILEKHFSDDPKAIKAKIAQVPTEGKWFEVNPERIIQYEYEFQHYKRLDKYQEEIRQLILEAFAEVKNNPEKYCKKFYTMIPEKNWFAKTVKKLDLVAFEEGDHIADWVEQALEWAQRIINAESWETICNTPDTVKCMRMILWKSGYYRFVGKFSATHVSKSDCMPDYEFEFSEVVPLVVLY